MPLMGAGAVFTFFSGAALPPTTPWRTSQRYRFCASDLPKASLTSCWLRISTVTAMQACGMLAWGNCSASRAHSTLFTPENVRALG
jgi:hypothetical protein